jgi:hypothetical protein
MTDVDEINAHITKLESERESAMNAKPSPNCTLTATKKTTTKKPTK